MSIEDQICKIIRDAMAQTGQESAPHYVYAVLIGIHNLPPSDRQNISVIRSCCNGFYAGFDGIPELILRIENEDSPESEIFYCVVDKIRKEFKVGR